MTEAERVVLAACRRADRLPVVRVRHVYADGRETVEHMGLNAVLVWSMIDKPRPRGAANANSVLRRMRSLVRQGHLTEPTSRHFRLTDDGD